MDDSTSCLSYQAALEKNKKLRKIPEKEQRKAHHLKAIKWKKILSKSQKIG